MVEGRPLVARLRVVTVTATATVMPSVFRPRIRAAHRRRSDNARRAAGVNQQTIAQKQTQSSRDTCRSALRARASSRACVLVYESFVRRALVLPSKRAVLVVCPRARHLVHTVGCR